MILRIARRELTQSLRDGRLIGAGALVLILLLTALLVGWQRHTDSRAERVTAQELDYDDWLSQPARHPHDAAHQGMHVFKPDMPLSIIDPGVTPYVGSTLWLQAHRQSEVKFRPAQDATGLQRFGSFSPAWILQVLGPLLVIILGFDAFTAEREQGTLRQLLSLGVTPRRLLAGKAMALSSSLALLFVPFVIVALFAVLLVSQAGDRADSLLRLLSLAGGYAAYFGIFIGLVLAVSAWARSSRLSLTMLLGIWIGVAVLAPRAIADASRSWFPSDSRREFAAKLGADLGKQSQEAWERVFGKDSGTVYGTKVPLSKWGIALQTQDRAGYSVMDRHFSALWDTYERQQATQEWFGLLVPTLAIRSYSMHIAGTDFQQHRAFSVAAERHRRMMQDIVSHDLVEHADGHDEAHFSYRASPELWRQVPPFDFRADAVATKIGDAARSVTVLAFALAAAWSAALTASRRLSK
jgi:ABC-2 type transport system permease protein